MSGHECPYCYARAEWFPEGSCCRAATDLAGVVREMKAAKAEVERLRAAGGRLVYAHFDKPDEFAAYLAGEDSGWSNVDAWREFAQAIGLVSSNEPDREGTP